MKVKGGREGGFSLIELMVAMVVTMIVAGAIYGLLADSQTGFRREPERTARQQNIRVAMDSIMRDIANAGSGLPALSQVFTPGLDACAACAGGGAPMGLNSQVTDELEMVTNDGARENEMVGTCPQSATSVAFNRKNYPWSGTGLFTAAVFFGNTPNSTWTLRTVTTNPPAGDGIKCTTLTFDPGSDTTGTNTNDICTPSANGFGDVAAGCASTQVAFPEVVRYRIRVHAEGVAPTIVNVPVLERVTLTSTQVVARGIEDLQVRYVQAAAACTVAAPCNGAPALVFTTTSNPANVVAPVATEYNSLVTQVIVTLSARSLAPGRIQGQTVDPTGGAALRGSLTMSGTPRSALMALTQQPVPDPSNVPGVWQ